jgi:hypothetical protein
MTSACLLLFSHLRADQKISPSQLGQAPTTSIHIPKRWDAVVGEMDGMLLGVQQNSMLLSWPMKATLDISQLLLIAFHIQFNSKCWPNWQGSMVAQIQC